MVGKFNAVLSQYPLLDVKYQFLLRFKCCTIIILQHKGSIFNVTGYGSWLKFNDRALGYYRVNYEETIWKALAHQLHANPLVFTEISRVQLLDDAFTLAR